MKKVILILGILMLASLASSTGYTAAYTWNTVSNQTQDQYTGYYAIKSDSIIFQVRTFENVICRYSQQSNSPFSTMASFDQNLGTLHKKTLTDLSDKLYIYYVKCRTNDNLYNDSMNAELEAMFAINSPIKAQISLDEDILNGGEYEVSLLTSKVPQKTPTLSYTYDGTKYYPIALQGSGTSWEGYLTVSSSEGEKFGSFKFEALDLEGNKGDKIFSGGIFEIDTTKPGSPSSFEAIGEYEQIRLEWEFDYKDIDEIKIYRSNSPGITSSDLYETVDSDEDDFVDNSVTKGKTYYYKISLIDDAGNIGLLSKEVNAAPRLDNSTTYSGLASNLISLVDSMTTELNLVRNNLDEVRNNIDSMEEYERALLEEINFYDEINSVTRELDSLEKEIVGYKLLDIDSSALNTRLSSSRIKLESIRKKIPESVSIKDSNQKNVEILEDNIRISILEYSPELSSKELEKLVKVSMKAAENSISEIYSQIYSFETVYLDGSKDETSIVKYKIDSSLEGSSLNSIIMKVPISVDSNSISMKNIGYSEIEPNLFKFEADTKEISFIISEEIEMALLEEINLGIIISEEKSTKITGNMLSDISSGGSIGIALLLMFAASLVAYLTMINKKKKVDSVGHFIKKAQEINNLREKGDNPKAEKLYENLKMDYISLSKDEKSKVFDKIKHLHKK